MKTVHAIVALGLLLVPPAQADDDDLTIRRAEWDQKESRLVVSGRYSDRRAVIMVENAATGEVIGVADVNRRERWRLVVEEPERIPCAVRASIGDESVTDEISDAPDDCDDGGSTAGGGGEGSGGGSGEGGSGGTGGGTAASDVVVLAANDLGMHCADLDYQVFSILPPFNVVRAQIIERGSRPTLGTGDAYTLDYVSVSSASDPAGAGSINTTSDQSATGVFKTNYWEDSGVPIPLSTASGNRSQGGAGYGVLYPSVLAAQLLEPPVDLSPECANPADPSGCPSLLDLFEPMPVDSGLPVPDLVRLGGGVLEAHRQNMPGPANAPQAFSKFDDTTPFYTGFPFGHTVANASWYSAEGIPILPVDDNGNPNSYPLMRVTARDAASGDPLSALDIVLPVASEADCQNCHAQPFDCADPLLPLAVQSTSCNGAGIEALAADRVAEIADAPGATVEQRLLNAAKINILRLHDQKHGALYTAADGSARACDPNDDPNGHCLDTRRHVQCSQCHYSPALDLAQSGPVDEPEQGPNGRQQTRHVSMSNAMHRHHGSLPPFEGEELFPQMPEPSGRSPILAEEILGQTCYQCHPGKRTQCLRGAMFAGGVVCQDCHGDMQQVGNDFSTPLTAGGGFDLSGNLRVPWANEPGCQSCHTGDAVDNNHPAGAPVADDGIRLLAAYLDEEVVVDGVAEPLAVARMISSPDSRFAENRSVNADGEPVDVLYRLSKGHGGVMCEGCHNSTHAIWPNQNPFANDNIAADQLQGHHGTLIECGTCHTGSFDIDDFKGNLDADGRMKGPHGMHPVASSMWNEKHKEVFEDDRTPRGTCEACHGSDGMGTVLSVTAATRTLECKNGDGTLCRGEGRIEVPRGTPIGCGQCHENEIGRRDD